MVVPDGAAPPDGWEALASFVADGGPYLVLWGPAPAEDRLDQLTPRELEIAVLVADGRDAKAIARYLRISFHTVREHLSRIYGKLGLHKQTELATCVTAHFAGSARRSPGPTK
jgi:DNA-binding NarL/FixJ family response regulator